MREGDEPGLTPSIIAAVLLHFCGLASLLGRTFVAAALLGAWAAMVSWRAGPEKRWRHRAVLAVPLALMLLLRSRPGFGGDGEDSSAASPARAEAETGGSTTSVGGDAHEGVILWPEEQPLTILTPPVPFMRGALFAKSREPLTIPFHGVYWLYRPPHSKPPPGSLTTRGSPAKIRFRSTDRLGLNMEARQNFGTHIQLACCSRIQLAITNGDRYRGTLSVELLLIDTASGRSVSLGTAPVRSTPVYRIYSEPAPVREVLDFPIPARLSTASFDEAVVRFIASWARNRTSPMVAIDRFVLVPAY